jgi:predicted ribosomally synthesized peptide with SipW-like signal peptide
MKKKLSISILAILLVGVLAFGAVAYFSDTEASTGNTFTAGTLDLQLQNPVNLAFNLEKIKPGDQGDGKVTLHNAGNLSGDLIVKIQNLVEDENGVLEPETEAGDPGGAGDLGLALKMAMFLDMNGDGAYNAGDIELEYSGNTNTTAGLQFSSPRNYVGKDWSDDLLADDMPSGLGPNSSVDLVILWQFPHDAYVKPDAIYMSDTLSFDINIELKQH